MNNYLFETLGYVAQSVDKSLENREQYDEEKEDSRFPYEEKMWI